MLQKIPIFDFFGIKKHNHQFYSDYITLTKEKRKYLTGFYSIKQGIVCVA